MSQRKYLLGVCLLTSSLALGQGPVTDKVRVNFPNPVVVAGTTLPAGEYTIRQLPSANNPRVLEFSSEEGTKVEVTTTAYPILDNLTRKPTSVILEQRGNTYHVSKIWLQGKSYGYGFITEDGPMTATASNQGGMRLTASYAPAPAEQQVAQATPRAEQPAPAPAPEPQPQPQQQTQDQAQATPPAQPAPTPTPAQEPAPTPTPAPAQEPAPAATTTPEMPATASHWTLLMVAGGFLTAAGWRMRRS